MIYNAVCPRCGSLKTQLVHEKKDHPFLWLVLFGWFYVGWLALKGMLALLVLIYVDWWVWLIYKFALHKKYEFLSNKIVCGTGNTYYCHNCGNNFKY